MIELEGEYRQLWEEDSAFLLQAGKNRRRFKKKKSLKRALKRRLKDASCLNTTTLKKSRKNKVTVLSENLEKSGLFVSGS